jgi:hypothetical protein
MKTFYILLFFTVLSCKIINQNTNPENSSILEKYTEMTIVENEKCQFLLQDKSQQQYEVQNIADKISGLKAGKKVWIIFQPLRRMSVCGAQPVEIIEVYHGK